MRRRTVEIQVCHAIDKRLRSVQGNNYIIMKTSIFIVHVQMEKDARSLARKSDIASVDFALPVFIC